MLPEAVGGGVEQGSEEKGTMEDGEEEWDMVAEVGMEYARLIASQALEREGIPSQ